jgi:hypothetical protein
MIRLTFVLSITVILLVTSTIYSQPDQTSIEQELTKQLLNVSYFGPRAGITYIPKALYDKDVDVSLYSLFGWQMDIRYKSSDDSYVGYGEAGLLLAAVEQGVFRPEVWGYIGIRRPYGIGISIGPNISKYGVGLGISPQYIIKSGNLLIPIMLNIVITDSKARMQIITGFSFDKKQQ